MTLPLGLILQNADIDPATCLVIRHAYNSAADALTPTSTTHEILKYTARQHISPRLFPKSPPSIWVIFMPEGGTRARLWAVVENHGEKSRDAELRTFDISVSEHLDDLRDRLVIGWRSPRTWKVNGLTAATYPVLEIADSHPIPFPGFDRLILDYEKLKAVMREHRYATWRTALASVAGIYLITDLRDGRQYVGKADGAESIRQRWGAYATNGYGGNVELRNLDPTTFQFSLLRVFDPTTPTSVIDAAESHFKLALGTRAFGLNRN